MKIFLLLLLSLGLAACSTTPDPVEPHLDAYEPPPSIKKPRSSSRAANKPAVPLTLMNIDYEGLSRSIGMDPPRETLGFKEKAFDTCGAGYGYSASNDCRQNYFAVINFSNIMS